MTGPTSVSTTGKAVDQRDLYTCTLMCARDPLSSMTYFRRGRRGVRIVRVLLIGSHFFTVGVASKPRALLGCAMHDNCIRFTN